MFDVTLTPSITSVAFNASGLMYSLEACIMVDRGVRVSANSGVRIAVRTEVRIGVRSEVRIAVRSGVRNRVRD